LSERKKKVHQGESQKGRGEDTIKKEKLMPSTNRPPPRFRESQSQNY